MRIIKKLDIHIGSAVVKTFLVGQFAFFCLFVFIDFLDKAFKLVPPEGMTKSNFFIQYYVTQLPPLFQTTAPFVFVLSCLISFARFQHNSQIVAINAAGISTFRILENLMFLSLVLGAAIFCSQEYLTPSFTKRNIELQPSEYSQLMENHLNFRDHCHLEGSNVDKILDFNQKSAVIDIDEIQLDQRSGLGFHTTFMDEHDVPRAKLFAPQFNWNDDQQIQLVLPVLIPYTEKIQNISLKDSKFHLTIPLEKVVLASVNYQALSFEDLGYFQASLKASTERTFRCFTPFFPFLMLLVSSVLALPLVFKKPVYAYFAGLGCCFGVFLCSNYLRTEIELAAFQAQQVLPMFVVGCFVIYLLRKNRIPT